MIEAFPTPAYWAYQVWANEQEPEPLNYKLGETLAEEVGACLLGGHGIPANVGLAAFAHLRNLGAFEADVPSEEQLQAWLSIPLTIGTRTVRYRFAKQKARYLHAALAALALGASSSFWACSAGLVAGAAGDRLQDCLLGCAQLAGCRRRCHLGHPYPARRGLAGFFSPGLTVERHYLQLEAEFLALSQALDVRASKLDALMWYQMMSASTVVHSLLSQAGLKAA
nr:8-oxoguanine DNA glycosylase [Pseudomonas sp. Teo4]